MPEPCHATVAFGPFDTDTRKAGKSRGHRSGTAGALRDIPPSDAPAGDQTILIFPISYENDLVGPAPEPRPSTVASRYSDSAYSEPGKSPSGSHPGTADAFCGFPSPRVSRAILAGPDVPPQRRRRTPHRFPPPFRIRSPSASTVSPPYPFPPPPVMLVTWGRPEIARWLPPIVFTRLTQPRPAPRRALTPLLHWLPRIPRVRQRPTRLPTSIATSLKHALLWLPICRPYAPMRHGRH